MPPTQGTILHLAASQREPCVLMDTPEFYERWQLYGANDNRPLLAPGVTPRQALMRLASIRERLRRENHRCQSLLISPERRRVWDELHTCEACLRWRYLR